MKSKLGSFRALLVVALSITLIAPTVVDSEESKKSSKEKRTMLLLVFFPQIVLWLPGVLFD